METPRRNRVTPMGNIEAAALRGAWTGNRGIIHSGTEIVRFHSGARWITCALHFKDRRHDQWQPHHFTWLYFHDEAVSFAAGHRPCAECRRADYDAYRAAWADALGVAIPGAPQIDRQLHGERIVRGTHRRRIHMTRWSDLPDGAFVLLDGAPALVVERRLVGWASDGYGFPRPRPARGAAAVITPPSTIAVLRGGYRPQIDGSAPRLAVRTGRQLGSSVASRVTSGTPASARLTGHPAFAAAACRAKASSSIPGTCPTVTSAMLVIVGTPSRSRNVTVALVRTESAGVPFWARMLASAIEKHEACAAAISCSGFAPGPSSKRDLYEYSPLIVSPAVNVPAPVGTSPLHSAVPFAGNVASLPSWPRRRRS
jgi:hypothetical protein